MAETIQSIRREIPHLVESVESAGHEIRDTDCRNDINIVDLSNTGNGDRSENVRRVVEGFKRGVLAFLATETHNSDIANEEPKDIQDTKQLPPIMIGEEDMRVAARVEITRTDKKKKSTRTIALQ